MRSVEIGMYRIELDCHLEISYRLPVILQGVQQQSAQAARGSSGLRSTAWFRSFNA